MGLRSTRAVGWVVLLGLPGTSCAHHVVLDRPPAAAAPAELRAAYFEEHRLERPARGEMVVRTRLFADTPTVSRRRASLKNGTPIEAVEDLRPLVGEASASALAMAQAAEARGRADAWMGAGAAVAALGVGAGVGLVGADLGIFPGTARVPTQEEVAPPLTIAGIGAAAAGLLVGGILVTVGTLARDEQDDATTRAYASFDADLRALLALEPAP